MYWGHGAEDFGGPGNVSSGIGSPLNSLICICYHTDLYLLHHWLVFVTSQICIYYITELYLLHHKFVFVTAHICIYYTTDLYLFYHRFVFDTTQICIYYTTDMYLLYQTFVFVPAKICILYLHWRFDNLMGSVRCLNKNASAKIYRKEKLKI